MNTSELYVFGTVFLAVLVAYGIKRMTEDPPAPTHEDAFHIETQYDFHGSQYEPQERLSIREIERVKEEVLQRCRNANGPCISADTVNLIGGSSINNAWEYRVWVRHAEQRVNSMLERVDQSGFCRACETISSNGNDETSTRSSTYERKLEHHRLRELQTSALHGCKLCRLFLNSVFPDGVPDPWGSLNPNSHVRINTKTGQLFYKLLGVEYKFVPFEVFGFASEDLSQQVFKHNDISTAMRFMNDSPLSNDSMQIISGWMQNCQNTHSHCQPLRRRELPSRLLRISENKVFLEEFSPNHGYLPYTILSYCWGAATSMQTTTTNVVRHQSGLKVKSLPLTLRHAIQVTKRLGYEYIWVDALCIIQDSSTDWDAEYVRMGEYYQNAVVTISALDAYSSAEGFLRTRKFANVTPLSPKADLWVRPRMSLWADVFRTAALNTRGWALQERLLSMRIIHFTNTEIFWECLSCCARESTFEVHDEVPDSSELVTSEGLGFKRCLFTCGSDHFSPRDGAFSLWYHLVQQCTMREFTKISDRLPAIEGIARRVVEITRSSYVGGIFVEDLASLCWTSHTRVMDMSIPSYSWSSCLGPITYPFREMPATPRCEDARFMGHHVVEGQDTIELDCSFIPIGKYTHDNIFDRSGSYIGRWVSFKPVDPKFQPKSLIAIRICTRRNDTRRNYLHNKYTQPEKMFAMFREQPAECVCQGRILETVVYFLIIARWQSTNYWGRLGLGIAAGMEGCAVEENRTPFMSSRRKTFRIGTPGSKTMAFIENNAV